VWVSSDPTESFELKCAVEDSPFLEARVEANLASSRRPRSKSVSADTVLCKWVCADTGQVCPSGCSELRGTCLDST
jgi:hypothetical protein